MRPPSGLSLHSSPLRQPTSLSIMTSALPSSEEPENEEIEAIWAELTRLREEHLSPTGVLGLQAMSKQTLQASLRSLNVLQHSIHALRTLETVCAALEDVSDSINGREYVRAAHAIVEQSSNLEDLHLEALIVRQLQTRLRKLRARLTNTALEEEIRRALVFTDASLCEFGVRPSPSLCPSLSSLVFKPISLTSQPVRCSDCGQPKTCRTSSCPSVAGIRRSLPLPGSQTALVPVWRKPWRLSGSWRIPGRPVW